MGTMINDGDPYPTSDIPDQSSPPDNPKPEFKYMYDKHGKIVGRLTADGWQFNSSAAPKSAPTQVASNNLKELSIELLEEHGCQQADKAYDLTLNLILDTILASEEMQSEKIITTGAFADTPETFKAKTNRNQLRADLRTMLEGMKT